MKLLRLAPENTKFGFMRFRRVSYPLSAFLSIVSVLMFLFVGMNFGIDFAGGTQVDMRAKSGEAQYRRHSLQGRGPWPRTRSKCSGSAPNPTSLLRLERAAGRRRRPSRPRSPSIKDAFRRRLRVPQRRFGRPDRFRRARPARNARRGRRHHRGPDLFVVPLRVAVRGRGDHRHDARSFADRRLLLRHPDSSSTRPRSPRSSPSSAIPSTRRWSCSTASAR